MIIKAILLIIAFLLAAGPAVADRKRNAVRIQSGGAAGSEDDLVRLTRQYKATLETVLSFHEEELKRNEQLVELRTKLYDQGIISRKELEKAQQALIDEKVKVINVRNQIAEADHLVAELTALKELAKAPKSGYSVSNTLIRYTGTGGWILQQSSKVEGFFTQKFGRRLPVSAYGQSNVHNRMGYDHHNAMDVAVHPDSPEGQALMDYLRNEGIPFIAFRQAVPGASTGAHIHIGRPSSRF